MMNSKFKLIHFFLSLLFSITLLSCSGSAISLTKIPEECEPYLFYELSSFDSSVRFLDEKMISNQKYLAVKTLSQEGYELLVLSIKSESAVFLATSPSRNVSISLNRGEAIRIYDGIVGNKKFSLNQDSSSSSSFHNECAFVRLKDKNIQDAVILNASKIQHEKNRANNIYNQLNVYFGLNELLFSHFPDFRKYTIKDLAGDRKVNHVTRDGIEVPEIELDLDGTTDERQVELFKSAIYKDLFFEVGLVGKFEK